MHWSTVNPLFSKFKISLCKSKSAFEPTSMLHGTWLILTSLTITKLVERFYLSVDILSFVRCAVEWAECRESCSLIHMYIHRKVALLFVSRVMQSYWPGHELILEIKQLNIIYPTDLKLAMIFFLNLVDRTRSNDFLPAAKPRRVMDGKPPPPPSPGKIESLEAFRGQRSMAA